MKDEAIELVKSVEDPSQKMNLLREYFQALILRSLHDSEAFINIAFVGGTALRFIHGIRRFSEDLDFSLHSPDGYFPEKWLKDFKIQMEQAGWEPAIRWNDLTTIHKSWVRFPSILHEVGLSPMRDQNLSIKLEIDSHPPHGARIERTLINRHRLLALQHYDMPSLMAGKIHALLCRAYPKGRDWYDLLWYCAQRPTIEPNMVLLQNALDQTQGQGKLMAGKWKETLSSRLDEIKMSDLLDDVGTFLELPEERKLFEKETILSALSY